MIDFVFDRILTRENICNLQETAKTLVQGLLQSKHFILYGHRNTGKTSLLQSVVLPEYLSIRKKALPIVVDFMGVKEEADICQRLSLGLQEGLVKKYPTQAKIKGALKALLSLQPKLELDPNTGGISLSFGIKTAELDSLRPIFTQIAKLHKDYGVVLVMDEFQDIAGVKAADAKLRSIFQGLPKMPMVILGSKKHLLANLFAKHGAPLAGWGEDIAMPNITPREYSEYINKRISEKELHIGIEETRFLQEMVRYIPEAVNIVCTILRDQVTHKGKVLNSDIIAAMNLLLEQRRSRFEELLIHYSVNEVKFLCALAKQEPQTSISGKAFLAQCGISSAGALQIGRKLESKAMIYKETNGYYVEDPLLARYLLRYR